MGLLEMSFTGAILIIAIAIARAVTINRLPKKTFLVLWGIVMLRLLVPVSVSSVCSIYSLMGMGSNGSFAITGYPMQQIQWQEAGKISQTAGTDEAAITDNAGGDFGENTMNGIGRGQDGFRIWSIVWIAGCVLCFAFFGSLYIKCRRQFAVSMPVRNDYADNWIRQHRIKRPVEIRQSNMINAPLTYGLRHPVILVPKNTDWENRKQLEYILMHEYIHIRRFDVITKLVLIIVLSIHWFNPFVWVMYILCNRDLELSCDEMVVRTFGEKSKSEYAHILVDMEEMKSGLRPLCNHFSKNATEKRIIAIMKIKKKSVFTIVLAAALVLGLGATFATSAITPDKSLEKILQDKRQEITGQIGDIISEAEEVRYSIENWELVIDSIDGNRADCVFYADWISTRKPEDDPMILGMYQAEVALTDEEEREYAEEIIDGWLIEMRSWEEEERLNTEITVLLDDNGQWSLYYRYRMDGVENLIPLAEYARDNWTENEEERRQTGINIINEALEGFRNQG